MTEAIRNLPPCPLSFQCVSWLDEIEQYDDVYQQPGAFTSVAYAGHDLERVQKLKQHARHCPTCSEALGRERKWRGQQRQALAALLAEGEQRVPSTTGNILATLRAEPHALRYRQDANQLQFENAMPVTPQRKRKYEVRTRARRSYLISLVAAIFVILASVGIIGKLGERQAAPSGDRLAPRAVALHTTSDWSSVLITQRSADGWQQLIENYNPANGQRLQLLSNCCDPHTVVDGVAHNGHDILYHSFDGQKTQYHFLNGTVYTVEGKGSNAIWSTDDQTIFVYDSRGLVRFNVRDGKQQVLPWVQPVTGLAFYREGYLYVTRQESEQISTLFQVNVGDGTEKKLTSGLASAQFWLSPDGTVIYSLNPNSTGSNDIHATSIDGTAASTWSYPNGWPAGYAEDGSLLVVHQEKGRFQLIQTGMTRDQDTVLVDDFAPGATALCAGQAVAGQVCDASLAMAPLATSFVFGASYADGSYQVHALDLQTKATTQLFKTAKSASGQVQLIGWDKLQTP